MAQLLFLSFVCLLCVSFVSADLDDVEEASTAVEVSNVQIICA